MADSRLHINKFKEGDWVYHEELGIAKIESFYDNTYFLAWNEYYIKDEFIILDSFEVGSMIYHEARLATPLEIITYKLKAS